MKKKKGTNKKGFTMVELIVVIVVLGLLMALALPTVLDTMKAQSKNVFADQIKSYAGIVKSTFEEERGEKGAGATLCYRIDKLKPSNTDTGCMVIDYTTGLPDKVYIYNNQFYYSASAVGSFAALEKQGGKLIKEIPAGGLTSFGSSIVSTANCPATCIDPVTRAVYVP